MKKFSLKILDIVIIGILLVASILPTGIVMIEGLGKSSENIVVKVDNKVVKEIKLDNIATSKTYEFNFNDHTGYIEVKDGKVRMLEMDKEICPNAICSDTGWINKSYQTIVCLPNNIIVTLEGTSGGEVDAQSF